jgi:hypothetical protein
VDGAAWDDTTRQRQHRIVTVLVRLPTADEDPDEDADDGEEAAGV